MVRIFLYTIIINLFLLFVQVRNIQVADLSIRPLTRFEQVRQVIKLLIQSKGYHKRWSQNQLDRTAKEILKTERVTGEHFTKILATIELESRFRYWITSVANSDGTRDLGLTQQNSEHYQHRCMRVLGRQCAEREVFVPWISVKLMRWRLIECKKFSGESLFLCYNSAKNVGRSSRYQVSWRKAYYEVLMIWSRL